MCEHCDPAHFVREGIDRVEGVDSECLVRYANGDWFLMHYYDEEGIDQICFCPWCGRKLD